MTCIGCDIKEAAAKMDVDQLIEEQLSLELNLVVSEERVRRVTICETCPFRTGHTCGKCGCFYKFRANLAYKDCPVGYWK